MKDEATDAMIRMGIAKSSPAEIEATIMSLRAENTRLTEERDALVETMKTIAKSSMDSVTRHEARSSLAKVKGSPDAR